HVQLDWHSAPPLQPSPSHSSPGSTTALPHTAHAHVSRLQDPEQAASLPTSHSSPCVTCPSPHTGQRHWLASPGSPQVPLEQAAPDGSHSSTGPCTVPSPQTAHAHENEHPSVQLPRWPCVSQDSPGSIVASPQNGQRHGRPLAPQ